MQRVHRRFMFVSLPVEYPYGRAGTQAQHMREVMCGLLTILWSISIHAVESRPLRNFRRGAKGAFWGLQHGIHEPPGMHFAMRACYAS